MDVDTRKFLENIHSLAGDAISERRVFIDDGVSESLPSDHPLQQIRILVSERLKSKKHLSKTVDKKIMEAARLRASGEKWEKIADLKLFNSTSTNWKVYLNDFILLKRIQDLGEKQ